MFDALIEGFLNVVFSPVLWLSAALALVSATLFSIWRWVGVRQLPRDWAAGLVGFALGHIVGVLIGLAWMRVGQVQLFWGTLVALVTMSLARRIGWGELQHRR